MEFWNALVERFGRPRAVTILGQCVLWLMAGARHPNDLPQKGLMSRARAYALLHDAREFTEWLAAEKGLTLAPGGFEAIQRIGSLGSPSVRQEPLL
jgi:hypothetical protein